jgi:hypothetical protein
MEGEKVSRVMEEKQRTEDSVLDILPPLPKEAVRRLNPILFDGRRRRPVPTGSKQNKVARSSLQTRRDFLEHVNCSESERKGDGEVDERGAECEKVNEVRMKEGGRGGGVERLEVEDVCEE